MKAAQIYEQLMGYLQDLSQKRGLGSKQKEENNQHKDEEGEGILVQ